MLVRQLVLLRVRGVVERLASVVGGFGMPRASRERVLRHGSKRQWIESNSSLTNPKTQPTVARLSPPGGENRHGRGELRETRARRGQPTRRHAPTATAARSSTARGTRSHAGRSTLPRRWGRALVPPLSVSTRVAPYARSSRTPVVFGACIPLPIPSSSGCLSLLLPASAVMSWAGAPEPHAACPMVSSASLAVAHALPLAHSRCAGGGPSSSGAAPWMRGRGGDRQQRGKWTSEMVVLPLVCSASPASA